MPLAVQIDNIECGNDSIFVTGRLIPSGNYPAGGDTVDFTNTTASTFFTGVSAAIPSAQPPVQFGAWSQNGNLLNQFVPIIGSAMNNSKLKISAASSFGTDFGANPYSAALLADVITFSATFKKLQ